MPACAGTLLGIPRDEDPHYVRNPWTPICHSNVLIYPEHYDKDTKPKP